MRGEQFYNWISASHKIFEVFEDCKEVYTYCLRWVDEYFEKGRFTFTENMKDILLNGVSNLYIKDKDIEKSLKSKYEEFLDNLPKNNDKLAFAFAPYLMFWNVRRFEKYFRENTNFNLIKYFDKLNEGIESLYPVFKILRKKHILNDNINEDSIKILLGILNKILKNIPLGQNEYIMTIKMLKSFREKHILDNDIDENKIENLLKNLNNILGILNKTSKQNKRNKKEQNEYIMAIKILHIIAPYYFPLLDTNIRDAFILNGVINIKCHIKHIEIDKLEIDKFFCDKNFLSNYKCRIIHIKIDEFRTYKYVEYCDYVEYYIKYIEFIKNFLSNYYFECKRLENEFNLSILKLLDEAFYVRYSIDWVRYLR